MGNDVEHLQAIESSTYGGPGLPLPPERVYKEAAVEAGATVLPSEESSEETSTEGSPK